MEWNEEMAKKYPTSRLYKNKNFLMRFWNNSRINAIFNFLDISPKDNVLDLGCEEGYVLRLIKSKLAVGLDMSKYALWVASMRVDSGVFVRGDARKLPFLDNAFDKMIVTELIEHVLDPQDVLFEVLRVLKKGGKVAFTFPDERIRDFLKDVLDMAGLYSIFLKNVPKRTEWHINKFTMHSFIDILPSELQIVSRYRVPVPLVGDTYFVGCIKK